MKHLIMSLLGNNYKKLGFDILKGQKIISFENWSEGDKSWNFSTENHKYNLHIEDDGCGCNDSNAYINYIQDLDKILNQEIIEVDEGSDSYGANITLKTRENECFIVITHDQNGYYGFSYELFES